MGSPRVAPSRAAGSGRRDTRPASSVMVTLRLFAAARDAAGTARDSIAGGTVGAVLDEAARRYGDRFAAVMARSRVWLNGEPTDRSAPVEDGDEVAILPPVSGGTG